MPDGAAVSEGRLGLALSGGGFRAAFFHVGVLARLAELDLLRQVEVISTVSGGSVVGAMYYLKLRNLLQQREDDGIEPGAYVRIVRELERELFEGVSLNLRVRTISNVFCNLRMYLSAKYSRSDRMAELYARHLFYGYVRTELPPSIPLAETIIRPRGEPADFNPTRGAGNSRRRNKVPALMVNATTLNTGHNFVFTSTWIGENPSGEPSGAIDMNTRLRRLYLRDRPHAGRQDAIPDKYRRLPLGVAVAASTAVPGLFQPLPLTGLYEGWTPLLVDGGVHDNQGIESLLLMGCTRLIVSDGCGQMKDSPELSSSALSTLLRSSSITMDRVREKVFDASAHSRARVPGGRVDFVHLKQDLVPPEATWIGGARKREDEAAIGGAPAYGVDRETQVRLSEIRTDLDSFSEVEASALMADGYLIARKVLDEPPVLEEGGWRFLAVRPYLADPRKDPRFLRQLDVGSMAALKVFWLVRPLGVAAGAAALAVAAWSIHAAATNLRAVAESARGLLAPFVSVPGGAGALLATLLLYGLLFAVPRRHRRALKWATRIRNLPRLLAMAFVTASLGSLVAWVHLGIFDRIFLRQGRLSRLKPGPAP